MPPPGIEPRTTAYKAVVIPFNHKGVSYNLAGHQEIEPINKHMVYNCKICNKTFKSIMSLTGHKRIHGISKGQSKKSFRSECCVIETKAVILTKFLKIYLNRLKSCKFCNKIFYGPKQIYCSRSCSAKFENAKRVKIGWTLSRESRQKTSQSLIKNFLVNPKNLPKKEIVGEYSKVFLMKCRHCGAKFHSRNTKQYCKEHAQLYMAENRNRYKFTFNVYHYSDLFDLAELEKIGWYSPGGKSGAWRIDGLSRDHKVSVNESIKNNYDPYYITHPINCQLISHLENNSKKTKSSISYDDLIELVDSYNLARRVGFEPTYRSRRDTQD